MTAESSDSHVEAVKTAIRQLQPNIDHRQVERVAHAVATTRCVVPWQIVLSIAFHESSLRMGAVNASSHDHGLMQINEKTAHRLGLSRERVSGDAKYAVASACSILADNKRRYSDKVPYWIGIYRSGTALHKQQIRNNARRYDALIRRTASHIGYSEAAE